MISSDEDNPEEPNLVVCANPRSVTLSPDATAAVVTSRGSYGFCSNHRVVQHSYPAEPLQEHLPLRKRSKVMCASPAPVCCTRLPRRWKPSDVLTQPLGVYSFKSCDTPGSTRYHSIFALGRTTQQLLGCFATPREAADRWDLEAHKHGWPISNSDGTAQQHLAQQLDRVQRAGFPYPPKDANWRATQLLLVLRLDPTLAWTNSDRALLQADHDTAPGNELCLSYHPHCYSVRKTTKGNAKKSSALATFQSCAIKCVRSSIEYRGDLHVTPTTLRGECTFLRGSWILNFQPAVAAAIYHKFAPRGGVVYDSSSGWGGRLVGARLARMKKYIGCEPCTQTFKGLQDLAQLIRTPEFQIELHMAGSETLTLQENSVDVAFTSPPYFSLELYSDEATQSHIKFPSFDEWCRGFLEPTFAHTLHALRPGGVMAINISNCKMFTDQGIDLEQQTCRIAISLGAELESTLRLLKSGDAGADYSMGEPVFVFRKPLRRGVGTASPRLTQEQQATVAEKRRQALERRQLRQTN